MARKVIIDTDCGVDDAIALMFALEYYDVIGITCVAGNTSLKQVCNNVGVVLEIMNRHVPFYAGSKDYILNEWKECSWEGHGHDGLGDLDMKTKLTPELESAYDALIRLTKEHDDINLIAIGPLTNIALTTMIDPDFPDRVKTFTIMGGTHTCRGNIGMASEFNVNCDPEAAHICLTRFPMTRMITLETGYNNYIPWEWYQHLRSTRYTNFIREISKKYVSMYRNIDRGFIVCDLIAVASLITEASIDKKYCRVELHGSITRGATLFDWFEYTSNQSNVSIIDVDMNSIINLLTMFTCK